MKHKKDYNEGYKNGLFRDKGNFEKACTAVNDTYCPPKVKAYWQGWLDAAGSKEKSIYDKPIAAQGLISYRCKTSYGYVMIGAKDDDDAWNEARRSSSNVKREDLEVWDGEKYSKIT